MIGQSSNAIWKLFFMTYNRLEAKVIPGEHCRFCGEEFLPLVKTRCCDQWVCCDTNFISIRGGGYCQFEHEHYSACYFHYNEAGKPGYFKQQLRVYGRKGLPCVQCQKPLAEIRLANRSTVFCSDCQK